MSLTHGGRKAKHFRWSVVDGVVVIENENGLVHRYAVTEVHKIVCALHQQFGDRWIRLANNVERMYHGTERAGMGCAIYAMCPGDTFHAQGASYLGVVLEEAGVFEWNGRAKGIAWRILGAPAGEQVLHQYLSNAAPRARRAPSRSLSP